MSLPRTATNIFSYTTGNGDFPGRLRRTEASASKIWSLYRYDCFGEDWDSWVLTLPLSCCKGLRWVMSCLRVSVCSSRDCCMV